MTLEELTKVNLAMKQAWDSYNSYTLTREQRIAEVAWLINFTDFMTAHGVTSAWCSSALNWLKSHNADIV
jgi:hypothetical protein